MSKKRNNIVNYKKIKRDLIIRDTNLDSRFTTKVVESKKDKSLNKKDKHKPNWKDGTEE